jgi:hypothetical protein
MVTWKDDYRGGSATMTPGARAFLLTFAAVVAVFAWLYRIDAKPEGSTLGAIVTNHWTGTVYYCHLSQECQELYPHPVEP